MKLYVKIIYFFNGYIKKKYYIICNKTVHFLSKMEKNILENELWNNHVDLGLWADLFIVAPATANP